MKEVGCSGEFEMVDVDDIESNDFERAKFIRRYIKSAMGLDGNDIIGGN